MNETRQPQPIAIFWMDLTFKQRLKMYNYVLSLIGKYNKNLLTIRHTALVVSDVLNKVQPDSELSETGELSMYAEDQRKCLYFISEALSIEDKSISS